MGNWLLYVYQFLSSNSNSITTSNIQIFPNIPKNRQKIYKTAQNVATWNELRDFWLLETWTRYLHSNHNTQQKCFLYVNPRLKSKCTEKSGKTQKSQPRSKMKPIFQIVQLSVCAFVFLQVLMEVIIIFSGKGRTPISLVNSSFPTLQAHTHTHICCSCSRWQL